MVPGGAAPLVCGTCTDMQSLLSWEVGWLARRPSNLQTSRGGVSSLKARCAPGRGTLPNSLTIQLVETDRLWAECDTAVMPTRK